MSNRSYADRIRDVMEKNFSSRDIERATEATLIGAEADKEISRLKEEINKLEEMQEEIRIEVIQDWEEERLLSEKIESGKG